MIFGLLYTHHRVPDAVLKAMNHGAYNAKSPLWAGFLGF